MGYTEFYNFLIPLYGLSLITLGPRVADSPLEGAGFEPSVPLLTTGPHPNDVRNIAHTHTIGAVCNHSLNAFTVATIARDHPGEVSPARPVSRTRTAAYPGSQKCRARARAIDSPCEVLRRAIAIYSGDGYELG
jgi:hypothetical protein